MTETSNASDEARTGDSSGAELLPRPVVAIFGLYGAGAEQVARAVATALHVPFHHQSFSSAVLEGGHPDLATADEATFLRKMVSVLAATFGGGATLDDATEQIRQDLIARNRRSVAECERLGGVVIGRNAAHLLAHRPRTLHVLLTGSAADRIARAAEQTNISYEHAARRADREDEVRADMAMALYGWDPRRPEHYDLVANTSRVPIPAVVAAIVAAVRAMPG